MYARRDPSRRPEDGQVLIGLVDLRLAGADLEVVSRTEYWCDEMHLHHMLVELLRAAPRLATQPWLVDLVGRETAMAALDAP